MVKAKCLYYIFIGKTARYCGCLDIYSFPSMRVTLMDGYPEHRPFDWEIIRIATASVVLKFKLLQHRYEEACIINSDY